MGYPNAVFSAEKTVTYAADEDDFMLLVHNNQAYKPAPSVPSGWTQLSYTSVTASGTYNAIYYRKATASEPTSVTVDAAPAANKQSLQLTVYKGIDTTTPFDVTVTSRSSASVNKASFPAITPATANALIVYVNIPNNQVMAPVPGPLKIERTRNNIIHGQINTYYTYGKGASVTVPATEVWSEANANINPTCVTIALRDDGNGTQKGYVDKDNPPAEILHILGKNGDTGHLTGTGKITNLASTITSLQGTTTGNNTNSELGGTVQPSFESGFTGAGYSNNFVSQACAVIGTSVNTTYNLENEIISLSSAGNVPYYEAYEALAKHFIIGDGTNFRAFRIDAANTVPTGVESPIVCIFEVDAGFETEEFGTVSASVLQAIDTFAMAGPANKTYESNGYGFLYKHNTMIILGGSTAVPADLNTAVECARTSSLRTVNNQGQQSQTQYYAAHDIQVGNGNIQTVWDSRQNAIEFPAASSTTERRIQTQVTAGRFGISFKASATCNFNFSNTTFNMGNNHVWKLMNGTSTSATYSESGCVIIGGDVRLRDIGRPMAGITFNGCLQLTTNGADLSGGCTIDGCTDTNAIVLTGATQADLQLLLDDIANCTFSNNTVGIRVRYTGTGDITLNFNGITASGNTTDIHYNSTNASALVANMQNGANLTTTAISGSATGVTIANDITTTINVNVSGSEITILDAGTQTELFHVETATTSEAYVYTYSSDFNGDIQVYKPGYKPFWLASNVFGNSNQTITVNLDEDPASQI